MKNKVIFSLLFVLTASVAFAQRTPDWVTNKPTPTNNTYLYVVESAFGNSEIQARNQAIARVFQSTAMRLGQPVKSEEINRAVQSGASYDVISRQFNIPVNKVCEYTENKTGNYRVYVLCQVAKSGNIPVQFDGFNDCYKNADKYYANEALMADGYEVYQNNSKIGEREVRSMLANSQAYMFYDRGIRMKSSVFNEDSYPWISIVFGSIFAGGGYMLSNIFDEGEVEKEYFQNAGKVGLGMLAFGGAWFLVRLGVNTFGKSQIRKAVNMYNNGALYSQNAIEMQYGLGGNGVFLTLSF